MLDTGKSSIILRFRDIGIGDGRTILEHKRVIGKHGYCWWGWLYRGYEKNPYEALISVVGVETAKPLRILLYDTGQSFLYAANCLEVKAYPNVRRSPQLDFTPAYYNDRTAPAWFKLSDIERARESDVIGRKCVDLPSASEECFTDLRGQVINSLRDLRRQEVTMWIIE
jgi:hypothetical protein